MLRWEEVSATRVVCKLGDLKVCAIERIPNSHTCRQVRSACRVSACPLCSAGLFHQ